MASFSDKLTISFGSALLFIAINLPMTYAFTNSILPLDLYDTAAKCPTVLGLLVHTLVFALVTYLSMGNPYTQALFKLKNTVYSALIFYFLSSPALYLVTSGTTCPTLMSVMLHAFLYMLALVGVMYFPE